MKKRRNTAPGFEALDPTFHLRFIVFKSLPSISLFFQQGKDPDKKRKTRKRCKMSHANNGSAIEAIEKIVQG